MLDQTMSLDKAIKHGKEKRGALKRMKALGRIDALLRCTCAWCRDGRAHREKRQQPIEEKDDE